MYTTRTTCRVCGSADLTSLFSLGEQFVSDFVNQEDIHKGHKCPIDIELCNNCTLVQAKHTAPQDFLYSRHYWYRSGVTKTMRDALRDVTRAAESYVNLKPNDIVLDIGSNDGTLLRSYTHLPPDHPKRNLQYLIRVGVEPAINMIEEGSDGIDLLVTDFWSWEAYAKAYIDQFLDDSTPQEDVPKAKVITACGMFYDLEDPNQFIGDVAKALAYDGVFIAQLMCLKQTLDKGDVGNFAHEHLEFYSLKSLQYLMNKHGLYIFDIEENNVNGGSYRIYVRHMGQSATIHSKDHKGILRVATAVDQEFKLHMPDSYVGFRSELISNKRMVVGFIRDKVAYGKKVWVYGASTKGNVILQYYGLDNFLIEGAADKSPEKLGKYTIGTGIPIVSEEQARAAMPDYFLVLPYSFLDEFVEREKDQPWRVNGGKFIVPLPEFKVI